MNRKLHNTVTALAATTGLLVLSLLAGRPSELPAAAPMAQVTFIAPDGSNASDARIARIVGAAAEAATAAAIAAAFAEANKTTTASLTGSEIAAPAPVPHKSARGRQSVAMPFFSFAPRG